MDKLKATIRPSKGFKHLPDSSDYDAMCTCIVGCRVRGDLDRGWAPKCRLPMPNCRVAISDVDERELVGGEK